jgi:hypothetical protein
MNRHSRALTLVLFTVAAPAVGQEQAKAAPQAKQVDSLQPSAADLAQHVLALQERTKGKSFTFAIERPFVVVGDGPAASLRGQSAQTVRWAVDLLRQDFFAKDPEEIIDVFAFKDADSYEQNAWELFHDKPDTPYGYYSARERALVMNIETGYGTLVHELVHPFVRANIPDCPPWFNEGLASLYEQSTEDGGHIVGLINWRLSGLQKQIRGKRLASFKTLTAMDDKEFYQGDEDHYAQSRYLMLYLQERGLLRHFVQRFVRDRRSDPTGYQTLVSVLGKPDMAAFQRRWEKYTGALDPRGDRAPAPE